MCLKAITGTEGMDVALNFGCAMWNDQRYEGLPCRKVEDEEDVR